MKLLMNKVTRNAIFFTIMIFFVYRLGFYIVSPLINATVVASMGQSSLGNFFNFLGGGNIQYFSLFALGVSPYITASIVIQLLENDLIPSVAEWKHQGVEGQNKRYTWTKYLAIIFAFVQSFGLVLTFYKFKNLTTGFIYPVNTGGEVGILEFALIALFITAGTTALIWLADRITEKGVGNGMSVIIMAGILARMPVEISKIFGILYEESKVLDATFYIDLFKWIFITIVFLLLVILIIYYTLAYRRININYVKNSKSKLSQQNYIPLKLNPAGVIPIIFVAPLMRLPLLVLNLPLFADNNPVGGYGPYETFFRAFFDVGGDHWYIAIVVYFILIVLFSIMYSYIQMNPQNMAENLEKQSAYIVGVRPGKDTERYLTTIINKTTRYGGIVLAILAILPIVLQQVLVLDVGLQLIGTGLIITVNVIVQTYQSLENKTESKNYKVLFSSKV